MTKLEYLLVCVMEECSEVTKVCAKALRFGLEDCHPNKINAKINRELLVDELCDLLGVLNLLKEFGIEASSEEVNTKAYAKIDKLDKYMRISQQSGHLKG